MSGRPDGPARGVVATSVKPAHELVRSLSAAGWHVAVVSGATSTLEALDAIAAALAFPTQVGRTLDALGECLADLDRPTALIWAGWEPLAVHAPAAWVPLLAVLRARAIAEGQPPFAVVFAVAPV